MVKIITDSSPLISPADAKEMGFQSVPLSVTLKGETYVELVDINNKEFVELVNKYGKEGHHPTSSQPSIGSMLDAMNSYPADQELLVLTMSDVLSGTHRSACSAAQLADHPENITVLDTKTLAGPHRYLTLKALEYANQGMSVKEIVDKLQPSMENCVSCLIPNDFGFLKRGGRLTPLAATIGGVLKIVPVLLHTENGLEKLAIKRTFAAGVDAVANAMRTKLNINENYNLYVMHSETMELAEKAKMLLAGHFPNVPCEIISLGPAFTVQGGPSCVAIQAILRQD
ncbi:MAG: DegV family protein [Oscillospiraceae bacterium]|nr:DegV family protein [Oscillospiraceae bacterium]